MPEDALAPVIRTLVSGHYLEYGGYATVRTRGTSDDLLIYTLDGAGAFSNEGSVHRSARGELTLLRAGTPHDYRTDPATGRWELLWVHFRPRVHWSEWLDWPQQAPGIRVWRPELPLLERVDAAMREMHQRATGGSGHREAWAMNALERVLLEAAPHGDALRLDPRVVRAIGYLRGHLDQPVRLSELAEHCHLSSSRLVHLFSAETGQSPLAFLEAERLNRAAHLLALTSRRVASIASEVGYPDPLYFARRFALRQGVSPRRYRARLRDEAAT